MSSIARSLHWLLLSIAALSNHFGVVMAQFDTGTDQPCEIPESGCFTDLNSVATCVAEKNAFQVETFVLCPGTVYKIGFLGSGGVTEDGFPALTIRANTRYLCGEDGKSENNCVITGGQFQIISTFNSFGGEVKDNVLFKGITFQDGESAGALLVAPGDVTFEDCIFRVSFVDVMTADSCPVD